MKEPTLERCPTLHELLPVADRKLSPQKSTDRRALVGPITAERGEPVRPDHDTLGRALLATRLVPTHTGLDLPRTMRVSLTRGGVRVEGARPSAAQRPALKGRLLSLPRLRGDLNGLDTRVRVLTASLPADWPRRTAAAGLTQAIAFERLVQELLGQQNSPSSKADGGRETPHSYLPCAMGRCCELETGP